MLSYAAWRLRISTGTVQAGLEKISQVLARTDALLADGRPYLLGGRFTAADLSFACMLAPFTLPRRYGVWLPDLAELPASMQSTALRFRQGVSGHYALRLFDEQRLKPGTG